MRGSLEGGEQMTKEQFVINDNYYSWLCNLVDITQTGTSYWLLANDLYRKEYKWFVPNDDNRAAEAKNLREKFCYEMNIDYDYDAFSEEVSMLELIIGLAYRCESIMADQDDSLEMMDWFWKLLMNVGLDPFTDDKYYELRGHVIVDQILDRVINRTYDRDGRGGLFPLNRDRKDQRKIELWYQMSAYLVENYYSDDEVV